MAVEKELLRGIELLKEGKEEGFNILYSHTYNYVYGRAKVIMKNEDDALDLTQETFIQAYKGIGQLEDVNNLYAWLGGIAYRQGMKIFRKRREVLVGEDAEGIFEDIEEDDSDYHPEAAADEKATSDIMKSLIEELPELQKATIMAYYYDNMKIDDIAEVFECSSNTVKSRLNYAKKFLKTKVEEHEKENRYKLHSLTPAVFVFAFRSLISGDKYVMSAAMVQGVYDGVCAGTGLTASAIAVSEAGAGIAEGTAIVSEATTVASEEAVVSVNMGAQVVEEAAAVSETAATAAGAEGAASAGAVGSSVGGTSTLAGIGGAAVTDTVVKTGMGLGMKIILGAAAALTVGAVTVGAMSLGSDSQSAGGNQTQVQDEDVQDEQADTEDDVQEEKVQKYPTHYESYTMSGTTVEMDIRYEFDENGFISKTIQDIPGSDPVAVETKWETTNDGYISRSYNADGSLQGVTYYDKNLNTYRSEAYNFQTGNLISEHEYNENGDVTKQVSYYPDGSINTKAEIEYDAYGNDIKRHVYSTEGNPYGELKETVYTYSYDYDENHRAIRKYLDSNLVSTYEYDDANYTKRELAGDVVIGEWVYDENGTLRSYYVRNLLYEVYHIYDEDGDLLEQTTKRNGEVLSSLKYTYTSVEELRGME